ELAEREQPERGTQRVAHLILIAGERHHRLFEIARHQELHAVAIERDQLAQKADRQQVLPLLLLLDDDLGEHRAGYVLVGLGVMHDKIAALLDHLRKVFERHITAGSGFVEAPVGVFLDAARLGTGGLYGPVCIHARGVPAWRQCCSATIARFMPISAINRTAYGANTGPPSALRPIIAAMTDAD